MLIKLRLLIILLLGWVFLFFNIERALEVVNVSSFVYPLVLTLMVLILAAPRLFLRFTAAVLGVSLLLYLALKTTLGYPILGVGLTLTIVEAATIALTVALFRHLTLIIVDFEHAIREITVNLLGLPPRLANGDMEEVYRELRRARRHNVPLTLAVIKTDENAAEVEIQKVVEEIQRGMRGRYLQTKVVRTLVDHLQESDIVVRRQNDVVVAMPHARPEMARRILNDLDRQTKEWGMPLLVGMASFPDQGTTLGSLITAAEHHLSDRPEPIERRNGHHNGAVGSGSLETALAKMGVDR